MNLRLGGTCSPRVWGWPNVEINATVPVDQIAEGMETMKKETLEKILEYASMPRHGTLSRNLRKDICLQINEGKTYTNRLEEAGLTPHWRGENIVLSVRPVDEAAQDALDWWMNDAPHRRNVLHPHYTHIGVGVAQTPEGWYVFVMDLMKPS